MSTVEYERVGPVGEPVLVVGAPAVHDREPWLDQLQAHWNEQLAAFKTYVEEEEAS